MFCFPWSCEWCPAGSLYGVKYKTPTRDQEYVIYTFAICEVTLCSSLSNKTLCLSASKLLDYCYCLATNQLLCHSKLIGGPLMYRLCHASFVVVCYVGLLRN